MHSRPFPHLRRRDLLASVGALAFAGTARASAAPVRIGQSLPLTGPIAGVVGPIAQGQAALLESVNAEGGVHGAKIELITLDDAAQPARTLENTRTLLDQLNVASLFGYGSVPGLLKALPMINERRVPLLGVYNGADILRDQSNPWLFTTTASLRDEIAAMVQNLATLNSRRLAVVYQNNELGRMMLPQIEAVVAQFQATAVIKQPIEPDGSNAKAASAAVTAAEPQAILLLATGAAVLGFMKARPDDARVPIYALSLAGSTALLEQLGPKARGMAFTQVVPFPTRQTTSLSRRFTTAMAAAKLAPTYDRMWGYLNASILVEVLKRSGPKPTSAGIAAAIERMTDVDIGGFRVGYSGQKHHGSRFVEITMVDHSGKFVR
jgi:branched-chain amino acid transport system substrate-binding protein